MIEEKHSIGPISDERWDKDYHFSPYRELPDKTYSYYASEISPEIYKELESKHQADGKNVKRLDVLAMEAVSQAIEGVNLPEDSSRISLVFGVMNTDESYHRNVSYRKMDKIKQELEQEFTKEEINIVKNIIDVDNELLANKFSPHISYSLTTSCLNKVKSKFGFQGKSFVVDAACASSLAAFDISIKKLKRKETDFVFAGGVEANLGIGTFLIFSKVGALTIERTTPLNHSADGITQGEGSVVFGLQRLSDAIKSDNNILGILKSTDGSSDGKVSSLFQPNLGGQLLSYSRAYKDEDKPRVDYIETHGTGTAIGDFTEMSSLSLFFNDFKIPVGSVKSLVGHTKASAGATSLLKCLYMMKNKLIPASGYFERFPHDYKSDLYVNKNIEKFSKRDTPLRFGISSFGFGGCNFHTVVQEFHKNNKIEKSNIVINEKKVLLVGTSYLEWDDFDKSFFISKTSFYKVPPKSLVQIDRSQLLAVQAVDKAFKDIGLDPAIIDKNKVIVLSASCLGLPVIENMDLRMRYDTAVQAIEAKMADDEEQENKDFFIKLREYFRFRRDEICPTNEDSGPGILNNVIAGRVCNAFNFKGKSYNVDNDEGSTGSAIDLAYTELQDDQGPQLIIVVGVEEEVIEKDFEVKRNGVSCLLLSNEKFVKKFMLKVKSEVKAR